MNHTQNSCFSCLRFGLVQNGDKKNSFLLVENTEIIFTDRPAAAGCPVSNPDNNCANGLFHRQLFKDPDSSCVVVYNGFCGHEQKQLFDGILPWKYQLYLESFNRVLGVSSCQVASCDCLTSDFTCRDWLNDHPAQLSMESF